MNFQNCPPWIWPISYLMRKKRCGKRVDFFFYLWPFQSNNAFFVLLYLSVTLSEKEQMMIRRKKRKKRVYLFHRSVWPLWHNMLEKRHTWIVYLEDWASWFSKHRHCKAVWNKIPSHFTAAATVLQRQLCRAGLFLYTFLYLLSA